MQFHYTDKENKELLVHALYQHIKNKEKVVFVCVGTDRSTGDSLGPLVGHLLKNEILENTYVYGDLKNPVHAMNLHFLLEEIEEHHSEAFVIAIDASLGKLQHIGNVYIEEKPLLPGSGVKKKLPPIGSIHIGGVVNIAGFMEETVLQSTRLYEVIKMAEYISDLIVQSVKKKNEEKRKKAKSSSSR